jgi:hypothetical protein
VAGRVFLLFGHKSKPKKGLQVDMGDLPNERENLAAFLQSHHKLSISEDHGKFTVESETLSAKELQHIVTKFVYRRNLNSTHWVSIEDKTIKINRFKAAETKKTEKTKKEPQHQSITQSWGL